MTRLKNTTRFALAAALLVCALPLRSLAATPAAASFSTAVPANRQSVIQLQGADADGTALAFATLSAPSHGALSNLNAATGSVVYTPTSGYTGADSFTYKVTSGGEDSSTATVTITVSNAKTTVTGTFTDASGNPRSGKVTFILTQQVTTPAGLVPAGTSVSASLSSSGVFSVQLYPSRGMNPQAYYQVWFRDAATLNSEPLGVYDIPLSASPVGFEAYKVTDTNLASRYTFASVAGLEALVNAVANASIAQLVGESRTTGKLQKWDGSNLSDSIVSESGGALTVAGSVTAAGFTGITAANVPSAVDAAKIGNGSVSNAEFQRLDGVTSNVQTQLDAKVGATGATLNQPTLNQPVLNSPTLPGTISVTNVNASGSVSAGTFVGNGAGLTGVVAAGVGGTSSAGALTLRADSDDAGGDGNISLITTGGHEALRVSANGQITEFGPLAGTNLCAVAAAVIGPANTTIRIATPQTVAASCTIPSYVTVERTGSGLITVAASQTLTIQGPINAGRGRLFAGAGAISIAGNKYVSELPVSWLGAIAGDVTDDTTALQTAITMFDAADVSGTVLLDTAGEYVVGGACQDASGGNAQILLPQRLGGIGGPQIAIRIKGAAPVSNLGTNVSTLASVVKSTLATGNCNLLGAKGTAPLFIDPITVYIEDVVFRMPNNPVNTALDLRWLANAFVENVKVDTGQRYNEAVLPTTETSYGIRTPKNNAVSASKMENVAVTGFRNCVEWNELASANNLYVVNCYRGLRVLAAHHPSQAGKIWAGNNTYNLVAEGGKHALNIQEFAIEHTQDNTAWYYTQADINDPSNFLRGKIGYTVVAQNQLTEGMVHGEITPAAGVQAGFNFNGAAYLHRRNLHAFGPLWKSLTLQNSWVAFGDTLPAYTRNEAGEVRLRGLISSGTAAAGTVLFQLPAGYRPENELDRMVISNGAVGRVHIYPNGNVTIESGSNVWLNLSDVSFPAEL